MKIEQISEMIEEPAKPSFVYVREVDMENTEEMEAFVDTFNEISNELRYGNGKLKHSMFRSKMIRGKAWMLVDGDTDKPVGTVALKYNSHLDFGSKRVREVGYLAIKESYRGLKGLMTLVKPVIVAAREFDSVFISTRITNRTMKVLLTRARLIEWAFSAVSPYSSNKLDYWVIKTARMPIGEQIKLIKAEPRLGSDIVEEQMTYTQKALNGA